MRWCCVENPTTGRKAPKWARSAALDDHGTVFVPAAMAGNEEAVLLAAAFDGVTMVSDEGHTYLPSDWIAQEYPEVADICTKIETKIRAHFAKNA